MTLGPPLKQGDRLRRLAGQHLGLGEIAADLEVHALGMARQERLQEGHGAGTVLLLHVHAPLQQTDGGIVLGLPDEHLGRFVRPLQDQGEIGRHEPGFRVRGIAQRPGVEHRIGFHDLAVPRRQHAELAGRGRGRLLEDGAREVDLRHVRLAQGERRAARLVEHRRLGVLGIGERLEHRHRLLGLAELYIERGDEDVDRRRRRGILFQSLEPRQRLGGLAGRDEPAQLVDLSFHLGRRRRLRSLRRRSGPGRWGLGADRRTEGGEGKDQ